MTHIYQNKGMHGLYEYRNTVKKCGGKHSKILLIDAIMEEMKRKELENNKGEA